VPKWRNQSVGLKKTPQKPNPKSGTVESWLRNLQKTLWNQMVVVDPIPESGSKKAL
jgi:hypothetical protein